MMSSEEILNSVIKNRDRIIKKKQKTKKMIAAICVCLAVTLTTAWYAASRGEEPYIPGGDLGDPIVGTDQTGVAATDPNGITETGEGDAVTDPSETTNRGPIVGDTGDPPGNTGNYTEGEFYMGERQLVYAPDYYFGTDISKLPDTLTVYTLDMEYPEFSDESYANSDAQLLEFIELLYGRDVMLEGKDNKSRHWTCYFDPKDPYIAARKSGATLINADTGYIFVPIDVTAVEDYREMSIDDALEYVTKTDYFKAGLRYIGIDEYDTVAHRDYYGYTINYSFDFVEKAENVKEYVENSLERSINVSVQVDPERESIRVEYEINLPSTYTEYELLETLSYEEALEQAKRYVRVPYCNEEDVKVSVKYDEYHWDYFAGSGERFYVPYYVFYFGLKDEEGAYLSHSNNEIIMVKGFKTPLIQEVIQPEE